METRASVVGRASLAACQEYTADMEALGFHLSLTADDTPVFSRYCRGDIQSGVNLLAERQKFGTMWRVGRKEWADCKGNWTWCTRWVAGVDERGIIHKKALLFDTPIAAVLFAEVENWGR